MYVLQAVYVMGYATTLAIVAFLEMRTCQLHGKVASEDSWPGFVMGAILWPIVLLLASVYLVLYLFFFYRTILTEVHHERSSRDP